MKNILGVMLKEIHLLTFLVSEAQKQGAFFQVAEFNINNDTVLEINKCFKKKYTLEDLFSAADTCFTNCWLKPGYTINSKYQYIRFTEQGYQFGRSKLEADIAKRNLPFSTKIFNYFEDRKSFFTAIAALCAVITLVIKFFPEILCLR